MNSLQQNERLYSNKTLSGLDPFTQINDRLDIDDAEIAVLQSGQFATTGTVTLNGTIASNSTASSSTILGQYDSTNHSDITTLTGGTTSGTLLDGKATGHIVMGLRADDASDSFSIVSSVSSASANFTALLFKIVSSGATTILGALSAASASFTGTLSAGASTLNSLTVANALGAGASTLNSLNVTLNSILNGTLQAGSSTLNSLNVTLNTILNGTLSAGASTLNSLTVTNGATVGTTLGVTGNATLSSSAYVGAATPSPGSSANASIASYASGRTDNYVQMQSSATGGTASDGVLIGMNNQDATILQLESGHDIALTCDNLNGNVRVKGGKVTVRVDSKTDGTFTGGASIGSYRADSSNNYLQLQNSSVASAGAAGTLVGSNGLNARLETQDAGGTVILATTGGSAVLGNGGTLAVSNNITAGNDITAAGNLIGSLLLLGSMYVMQFSATLGGGLGVGDVMSMKDSIYAPMSTTIRILGYTALAQSTAGSGSITFRLQKLNTSGAVVAQTGADIIGFANVGNGWANSTNLGLNTVLNYNSTTNVGWGYTCVAVTGSAPVITRINASVFYRIDA